MNTKNSSDFYKALLSRKMGQLDILNTIEEITDSDLVKVKALENDLEMYLCQDIFYPVINNQPINFGENSEGASLGIRWRTKEICRIRLPESRGAGGLIITPFADLVELPDDKYILVCDVINLLKSKIQGFQTEGEQENTQNGNDGSQSENEQEYPQTNEDIYQPDSQTKHLIKEMFDVMDNKGWEYAFKSESDYNSFTDLLTRHLESKKYQLPEQAFQLKYGCKVRLAATLGRIHAKLSNNDTLKNDKKFFEIVRTLSHYKDLTKDQLYKDLSRFGGD